MLQETGFRVDLGQNSKKQIVIWSQMKEMEVSFSW